MKLIREEFEKLADKHGYKSAYKFYEYLTGTSHAAYSLLISGDVQIGSEEVVSLYNELGESVIKKIIDFEDITLKNFKGRYVQIGPYLF